MNIHPSYRLGPQRAPERFEGPDNLLRPDANFFVAQRALLRLETGSQQHRELACGHSPSFAFGTAKDLGGGETHELLDAELLDRRTNLFEADGIVEQEREITFHGREARGWLVAYLPHRMLVELIQHDFSNECLLLQFTGGGNFRVQLPEACNRGAIHDGACAAARMEVLSADVGIVVERLVLERLEQGFHRALHVEERIRTSDSVYSGFKGRSSSADRELLRFMRALALHFEDVPSLEQAHVAYSTVQVVRN